MLHRPYPLCQVHQIGMVGVSEGKKSNGIVKNHIGKLQISEIAIFQIEENWKFFIFRAISTKIPSLAVTFDADSEYMATKGSTININEVRILQFEVAKKKSKTRKRHISPNIGPRDVSF